MCVCVGLFKSGSVALTVFPFEIEELEPKQKSCANYIFLFFCFFFNIYGNKKSVEREKKKKQTNKTK